MHKHCINGFNCYQLTQAKGLRQSIDINSHLLCFDHTAGQRECIPFWNQINYHQRRAKKKTIWKTSKHNAQAILFAFKYQSYALPCGIIKCILLGKNNGVKKLPK